MHEKGAPVLYGPRISLIMLSSPSTSVATSSLVSPVFMPVSMFLFGDVGSFGIDMFEVDGIALCFGKASIGSAFEIDDVFGMGIEIWI